MIDVRKPSMLEVPLSTGLAWRGDGGFLYEEKMDGCFATARLQHGDWKIEAGRSNVAARSQVLIGEKMRSGEFYAFDVAVYDSQDVRGLALRERLLVLDDCLHAGTGAGRFKRPARGHGGELLEAVLVRGGEGIVAKPLDAPFGSGWIKCKRAATFDLVVVDKDYARGTIYLADPITSESRGGCPCKAHFEAVQIGMIVEVAAFGLQRSGKLREPRICEDEMGFIKIRWDKMNV